MFIHTHTHQILALCTLNLHSVIYQLYRNKAGREGKVNIFKHQNHFQFKKRRRNEKEYILERREGTSRKVLLGEIINGNLLGIIL